MIAFDVCGTLYRSNTTFDFVRFLYPRSSKVLFSLPVKILNRFLIKLFKYDLIRSIAIRSLKGISKEILYRKADKFVKEVLDTLKLEEVHALLDKFDRSNVCLISASIDPVINAIAKQLNVSSWYSSELDYVNGLCMGRLASDLLGKKHHLFVENAFSSMVTDNRSDLLFVIKTDMSYLVANRKTVEFWESNKREQDVILLKD